ncbi:MAG: hypothetical protein Q7K21_05725, partial [Elusimicrobiota bacterium]|nr:hypothetical protein [Elusimicrobiota bacterium]
SAAGGEKYCAVNMKIFKYKSSTKIVIISIIIGICISILPMIYCEHLIRTSREWHDYIDKMEGVFSAFSLFLGSFFTSLISRKRKAVLYMFIVYAVFYLFYGLSVSTDFGAGLFKAYYPIIILVASIIAYFGALVGSFNEDNTVNAEEI